MTQRTNILLVGGVLALALFGAARAGPLEDALAAYQRGDYATAVQIWRPLAEQGDAFSQNSIGTMYQQGQGVAQDYMQAAAWYRRAADQGYADAQCNLGAL
jgi:TPR repeat protein